MKIIILTLLGCFLMNPNLNSSNSSTSTTKNNYIIISGCSGGGKSTLLTELEKRGFATIQEPGRQIVREQIAIGGDSLPWINLNKFLELALSRYLYLFNSEIKSEQITFFDRSIVDAIQLDVSQPLYFREAAHKFKYNQQVFLTPPWEEIFVKDAERKHDFVTAEKEFNELLNKYKNFGYETILIPKISVGDRADFILNKLQALNEISQGQRLLEWNKEKLTAHSNLSIENLEEMFAPDFIVIANGRKYDANYQNYYEFLNKFRSDIESINYQVQEYINSTSTVVMPLKATVKRLNGEIDTYEAILLLKFNNSGKITHWQEVYNQM